MTLPQPIAKCEADTQALQTPDVYVEGLSIQFFSAQHQADLRNDWLRLEELHLGSAYHAYEWCQSWCDHIAENERAKPLFVVGYSGNQIQFLLPLAIHSCFTVKTAKWLGTEIFNQNTGYWTKSSLSAKDANELRPLLAEKLTELGIDLILLSNMATHIGSTENPLVRDDDLFSTNAIYPFQMHQPTEEFIRSKRSKAARKKHRSKQNKLQQVGALEFKAETAPADIACAVEAMIEQRQTRQSETGIPNAFSSASYRSFIRSAFENLTKQASPTQPVIYTLRLDGEIISTCMSLKADKRIYCYCTSIQSGTLMRHSPGELLMQHVIEEMCDEGMTLFDFGLGEERFKLSWAEPEYLKDWIEPLSRKGKVAATIENALLSAKRRLRNNHRFWKFYRKARGKLARFSK